MENTNLVVKNDETGLIGELQARSVQFCSLLASTREEKAFLFKVMNTPDAHIADMVNMTINIKDIYAEIIEMADTQTGEIIKAPRLVFIDVDGKSYQCVSKGMFSALKKLISIYGLPTWEEPIPITIKQIKKNQFTVLTFEVTL